MYVVNGSIVSGEQYNNNSGSAVPDPIPNGQTIAKKAKQKQLRKEQSQSQHQGQKPQRYSTTPEDFGKMYEPVNAGEIRRQKNASALKKYLREFAADWDTRVSNLNTLRRGKVLKDLKKSLRETIDLDNVKPEDLGKQVQVALREALDSSYEAISNVNIGHMYVPMEENPSNSKARIISQFLSMFFVLFFLEDFFVCLKFLQIILNIVCYMKFPHNCFTSSQIFNLFINRFRNAKIIG